MYCSKITFIILQFCESVLGEWLTWMVLSQGFSRGCSPVRHSVGCSHLKAWLGLQSPFPGWLPCRAPKASVSVAQASSPWAPSVSLRCSNWLSSEWVMQRRQGGNHNVFREVASGVTYIMPRYLFRRVTYGWWPTLTGGELSSVFTGRIVKEFVDMFCNWTQLCFFIGNANDLG